MKNITDEALDLMLDTYFEAEPYYPSAYVIDPALFAPAPTANRTRVIAAAASLVLVSAASASLILALNQKAPEGGVAVAATEAPTSPTNYQVYLPQEETTLPTGETPSEAPIAQTTAPTEKTAVTPAPTEAAQSPAARPTEKAAARPTEKTAVRPTEAQSSHPSNTILTPEEAQIDLSRLRDGKLYFTISPTAMNRIDSPDAFSDKHLMIAETKWGVVTYRLPDLSKLFQPFEPFGHSGTATPDEVNPTTVPASVQPVVKYHYYYYNSDGAILYGGTVYR